MQQSIHMGAHLLCVAPGPRLCQLQQLRCGSLKSIDIKDEHTWRRWGVRGMAWSASIIPNVCMLNRSGGIQLRGSGDCPRASAGGGERGGEMRS